MVSAVFRHGVDRSHTFFHKNIAMFSHMVCLTTESLTEQLPFYDEANQLAITASCRLFNRTECCAKLGVKDEITLSDSQIVLLCYRAYGKDFVRHILGEYAIVIWDGKLDEFICVTDLVNSQSLYYYTDEQSFIFASEVKALQVLPQINRQYNFKKIARSGVFPFINSATSETYFSNIHLLPAAHILVVSKSQQILKKYWEPELPDKLLQFSSDAEFTEAFQEVFGKVIKSTTRSHLPVCSLLSGGLDSTAVTAMAATTLASENRQLISLSSVLPDNYVGTATDERYFIDLLKKDNLTKQYINHENFGKFDNLDSYIETPKATQAFLWRQFSQAARNNGAKIILDGWAGETGPTYWGTEVLAQMLHSGKMLQLFKAVRQYRAVSNRPLKRITWDIISPNLPVSWQRNWRVLYNLSTGVGLGAHAKYNLLNPEFVAKYTDQAELRSLYNTQTQAAFKTSVDARVNNLAWLKHCLSMVRPYSIIQYEAMSVPINYSFPFLDKRLIEFCLAVPNEYRFKNGYERNIIRQGMKGVIPDELRFRTCKAPNLPNRHDRYNRQIGIAQEFVAKHRHHPLLNEVIDMPRLEQYLNSGEMKSSKANTVDDYIKLMIIPQTIYLASFLLHTP